MPASLIFRAASSRDVFLSIAKFADISIAFDPTFRDAPVTIDLRNASLENALGSVADATRAFFRVTAPRTVLVVPDTPAKRREYEEEVVRTFYLSNADLKETMDLLRIVLDARRISPTTATNALTIKDTPERIAAAARVLSAIDKARPEVIIDVELLEVDRTRLQEYGLQLASPGSPGINGSATISTGDQPDAEPALAAQPDPGRRAARQPAGSLLPAAQDRHQHPHAGEPAAAHLRGHTGAGAVRRAGAHSGHDVFADRHRRHRPAADHVVQLREHRREHRHHPADASRRRRDADASQLAVQSISGTGFGDLPTFGNREINTVIRLRDGETNMLAGLIRDDERRVLNGIPGLSDIAGPRPAVRAQQDGDAVRPTSSSR